MVPVNGIGIKQGGWAPHAVFIISPKGMLFSMQMCTNNLYTTSSAEQLPTFLLVNKSTKTTQRL